MNFSESYRTEPLEQAELFNEYFFEKFTSPGDYNISIDFRTENSFDIDFNSYKVEALLSNINANKAMGPDGILCKILKNCPRSLSFLLLP